MSNITADQIQAESRKESLIAAIDALLGGKIEHGKTLPDMTNEVMAKLVDMRASYLSKAKAQDSAFFANLANVGAAMKALNAI